MNSNLIAVAVIVVFANGTFGNTDLSNLMPNIQEEWFKYLKDPNRATFRSEECNKQVDAITSSLMQMEEWALQMFDATSKLQSGIFQGNFVDLGDFAQCLKVRHISQELGLVKGQHCLVFTNIDLVEVLIRLMGMLEIIGGSPIDASHNLNHTKQIINNAADLSRKQDILTNIGRSIDGLKTNNRDETKVIFSMGFATCLPAVCSPAEVKEVMNDFLGQLLNSTVKDDYDQGSYCNIDEAVELRPADIACITVFSFIGLLMILSTSYDVIKNHIFKGESPAKPLFLAFSVLSNGKKLFAVNAVDPKSKGDTLHCLHGLRALSMMWVVFCHRYTMGLMVPMRNLTVLPDWIDEFYSCIVTGGSVSVDTFFVLSGLLLSYIFLKTVTKTGRFNVPLFYIHRYLRITPPLAAMIFFQATLLNYFGSGPYWKFYIKDQLEHFCKTTWWPAFLYVQNYVGEGLCHGPSWYLAVDMQLFMLSPLILVPLWKWAKAGVAFAVTLILASLGIIFAITYIHEFGGAPLPLTGGDETQMTILYMPTHTRFGPWLMGILLGYLLHVSKNTVVRLNWMTVTCGWIASIVLFFTVLFGVHPFIKFDGEQDLLAGAFYQTFSRITWSLSICWIIFACIHGYGGPVNWFLSMPFWQPISRLSFCLYLTHYPIQMALQFAMKQTDFFSDFNMIYKFWGDFGIALTLSVLWSLAFESPITVLEKALFHSNEKPKTVLPTEKIEIENENLVLENNGLVRSMESGGDGNGLLNPGQLNNGFVEDYKR